MPANNPYLRIASKAAHNAGSMMLKQFERLDRVEVQEKSKNDYVSSADLESEQIIIDEICSYYPKHRIITEERGQLGKKQEDSDNQVTWIIDPLDGTTNFLHGIPHFAISIACIVNGKLEHGLIYDPVKNEEFSASRGNGAQLNNRKIRATNTSKLSGSLLATGIPFSGQRLERLSQFNNAMNDILAQQTCGIRRLGSAALDLAYVAAGRYDGFWEQGLASWDIAAGILIARESGAIVSDFNGAENSLTSGDIVSAPPKVYRELLPIIKKSYQLNK